MGLVNDRAIIRPHRLCNRWQPGQFHSGWCKPGHFSVPTGFCRDSGHATQNRDCPGKTGTSGHPNLNLKNMKIRQMLFYGIKNTTNLTMMNKVVSVQSRTLSSSLVPPFHSFCLQSQAGNRKLCNSVVSWFFGNWLCSNHYSFNQMLSNIPIEIGCPIKLRQKPALESSNECFEKWKTPLPQLFQFGHWAYITPITVSWLSDAIGKVFEHITYFL